MSEVHAFPPFDTLAPWAEIVPDAGPMTLEELAALPATDVWCCELVEGIFSRMRGGQ